MTAPTGWSLGEMTRLTLLGASRSNTLMRGMLLLWMLPMSDRVDVHSSPPIIRTNSGCSPILSVFVGPSNETSLSPSGVHINILDVWSMVSIVRPRRKICEIWCGPCIPGLDPVSIPLWISISNKLPSFDPIHTKDALSVARTKDRNSMAVIFELCICNCFDSQCATGVRDKFRSYTVT